MTENPILKKAIALAAEGKVVVRIEVEKLRHQDRRVVFCFSDGATEMLQTVGDHEAFMRWWKEAGDILRALKQIEPLRGA
jgi:hypothetical protein